MCVSCRQMFDRRELLRVVKSPDGVVSVDVTGKKNGRGAYICSNHKCIHKSAKGLHRKHLACENPPQIYEEIRSTYGDKK